MSVQTLAIAELFQIAHNPAREMNRRLQDVQLVPQKVQLSSYEKDAMCGVVCNLIGLGVESIGKALNVGTVYSLDITPHRRTDPTILVCPSMDLVEYYDIWGQAVGGRRFWNGWDYDNFVWSRDEYHKAMNTAIRSARDLSREELYFAVLEMLRFQNEMMCR